VEAADPTVIIEEMLDEGALKGQFNRAINRLSLDRDFKNARGVFIKPNLTYPNYREGVTTRFEFIHSLVRALREVSEETNIYIGEGEGGYNSFSMTKAMEQMGFLELSKEYPRVEIVNLSKMPLKKVEIPIGSRTYNLQLPVLFQDCIDFSITCPVPKVHCMTGISLGFKNQWGCIPDTMRLRNHYMFDKIISPLARCLKVKYAFLDGKFGLDCNGPILGQPVLTNWFVASNSIGAFDTEIAALMGINWKTIKYLRQAQRNGLVPEKSRIRVERRQSIKSRRFVLNRTFWNYPALYAFRSQVLTWIVYDSALSKSLHNLMYLFRSKPIA
jgi:uncharacterized protein (DUF362 family)